MEENKRQYTPCYVKRSDSSRQLHHISVQTVKKVLYVVDKKILQNLPILQEYFGMAEEIYGPSVPHLQGKTVHHNIQNVEPTIITNASKYILDKYKKFAL